ncbi:DNA mismatch repair protein MutT [Paractinoplanes abujensis]|uniref:ADP-ribose pyrophosphatase YjhB (NUDIX family) n=1 Tax=Paractinoplanes abujensis TaxID=882441 RepID=A0A7W7D1N7_9ACTN|nr:NUDIX domain-containing protein [Actinoplanes abujensis]MBB4698314.1 ADP-ribose pyrophosphatase YjhB (NUDIX family) [Actinoplanes abujensis]GID19201.1 DNA mismatch repair protein MutT [Actinoplanes abujensis]
MPRYARRSARVLLIDSEDRVLLLRSALLPGPGHVWLTPGGGVKWWERLRPAAARELREEVGLAVRPRDLRPVAFTTGHADLTFARGLFRDDFFVYRVDRHEVDTSGHTELERKHYAGFRWWSAAELAATDETVYPFRLAGLLADLVVGASPAELVELPWHHFG